MSVSGRNWRFPTIPAGSASLVRAKTDWIRNLRLSVELPGTATIATSDSIANCKQCSTAVWPADIAATGRNIGIKPHQQLHDDTAPRIEVGCVLTRIARARDCGCVHPILAPGSEIRPAYLN